MVNLLCQLPTFPDLLTKRALCKVPRVVVGHNFALHKSTACPPVRADTGCMSPAQQQWCDRCSEPHMQQSASMLW